MTRCCQEADNGCQARDTASGAAQRCTLLRRAARLAGLHSGVVAADGAAASDHRHLPGRSASHPGRGWAAADLAGDRGCWPAAITPDPDLRFRRDPPFQHPPPAGGAQPADRHRHDGAHQRGNCSARRSRPARFPAERCRALGARLCRADRCGRALVCRDAGSQCFPRRHRPCFAHPAGNTRPRPDRCPCRAIRHECPAFPAPLHCADRAAAEALRADRPLRRGADGPSQGSSKALDGHCPRSRILRSGSLRP